MDTENFRYRLRKKQFTPAVENLLKALNEWLENNPDAANCQQIANLAGVDQTYIQRVSRVLEEEGFVKLWRPRSGMLCNPGVFVLKGYRALIGLDAGVPS